MVYRAWLTNELKKMTTKELGQWLLAKVRYYDSEYWRLASRIYEDKVRWLKGC